MAINSKDLLKTGGFVTRFISATQIVPVGASGVLFTLIPPQGQRVRLDGLVATGAQPGISVSIGGKDIITSKTLSTRGSGTVDYFTINADIAASLPSTSAITGGVNEEFTVTNTGAATTFEIRYTYQFGE